jgi:hypothetical protein
MRVTVPAVALAGVLLASGAALAVASELSEPAPTPPQSNSASPPAGPGGEVASRTPGPPPWAGPGGRSGSDAGDEDDGRGRGPDHHRGRGPDATGPAAYGLCRAWAEQEDPAAKAAHVPPFRNLAAAAGGVEKVEEYCAALPPRAEDHE